MATIATSDFLLLTYPHRSLNFSLKNGLRFHYMCKLQGVRSACRLGYVDLDFECCTVCPILPGLMGIWQKQLGKMVEHQNLSQHNPGLRPVGSPCMPVLTPLYRRRRSRPRSTTTSSGALTWTQHPRRRRRQRRW